MAKPVILTGLRANNDLHIGNYFGALLPIIDMALNKSSDYDIHLFIPDLHSFTTPIDHQSLQRNIIDNLKLFVAAGLPLDKENVYIYRQSYVPAHSELTWILDCFTSYGEMSRMTQFKDKSQKLADDRISVGLFNYPVLMASDILLYGAKYVPVGEDQSQHLEFIRDIAERMNKRFGDLFLMPEAVKAQHQFFNKDQGLRIKDLADPSKKMSKSEESDKGIIFLNDKPADAAKKIISATTDSLGSVNYDPLEQPGVTNLLQILALFTNSTQEDINAEWQGNQNYGELKKEVASKIEQFLTDFQQKLSEVDESYLINKLLSDEVLINKKANLTLSKVQSAVGLRP
jgi:tryptophanyl-tRNA synthetase